MKKRGPETRGGRIRKLRGDLTPAEFAEMVRVEPALVGRYEADLETPPPRVLLRMARVSGVSIEWILTGAGPWPGRRMDRDEFIGEAALCLRETGSRAASEFVEMMADLFDDEERMAKVLSHYRFLKR
ncbi:MAG TPA: helix-turn-helix transcriptional regulator [bacterium]|nr:helix-turn-helix transcriptional regulator [bacterium]